MNKRNYIYFKYIFSRYIIFLGMYGGVKFNFIHFFMNHNSMVFFNFYLNWHICKHWINSPHLWACERDLWWCQVDKNFIDKRKSDHSCTGVLWYLPVLLSIITQLFWWDNINGHIFLSYCIHSYVLIVLVLWFILPNT